MLALTFSTCCVQVLKKMPYFVHSVILCRWPSDTCLCVLKVPEGNKKGGATLFRDACHYFRWVGSGCDDSVNSNRLCVPPLLAPGMVWQPPLWLAGEQKLSSIRQEIIAAVWVPTCLAAAPAAAAFSPFWCALVTQPAWRPGLIGQEGVIPDFKMCLQMFNFWRANKFNWMPAAMLLSS